MRNSSYSIVYIVRPLKKVSIYIYDVEKADNNRCTNYKFTNTLDNSSLRG